VAKSKPLCMFCGEEIDDAELTREHFVPKCLWEKGNRPNETRTLPAHNSCNSSFSEDNDYFRDVLALEMGAEKNAAARLVQQGSLKRKFSKHPGAIRKNLSKTKHVWVTLPSGLTIRSLSYEVDFNKITRVLWNVTKGIYYTTQGEPLPNDFVLEVVDLAIVDDEEYKAYVESTVKHMVGWQSFGDDAFACRYVVSSQRPITKMNCLMQFYGNRLFFGQALHPDEVAEMRRQQNGI
jgi:hypothetical protein